MNAKGIRITSCACYCFSLLPQVVTVVNQNLQGIDSRENIKMLKGMFSQMASAGSETRCLFVVPTVKMLPCRIKSMNICRAN